MYGGGGSLGGCSAGDKMRGRLGEAGSAILRNDGGGRTEKVVGASDFPRLQDIGSWWSKSTTSAQVSTRVPLKRKYGSKVVRSCSSLPEAPLIPRWESDNTWFDALTRNA